MALDTERVETVTVDSYGTLVDVHAAEDVLADYVDDPEAASSLWRDRSIQYVWVVNDLDAYKPFYELLDDALEFTLEVHGGEATAEERAEILSVYHDLVAFDDVREGLTRLDDGGYDVYVLSNGTQDMLDSIVDCLALDGVIRDTISADDVQTYKPRPKLYRHAAATAGTPPEHIAHVSVGWSDVRGGMNVGTQGVWMNRLDLPWDPVMDEPDMVADTFHDLADELGV